MSSMSSTRRSHEDVLFLSNPVGVSGNSLCYVPTRSSRRPARPLHTPRTAPQQRSKSRINASFTWGLPLGSTNWDVQFQSQFLDLFGSEPLPTRWEDFLSLGLKFLLLEFPQSQSELSHRLVFSPVPGPQQLRHYRLDQLVLSHGCQSNWFVACLRLQLFAPCFESFSH